MKWIAFSLVFFVLLESCSGQETGIKSFTEKEFYNDGSSKSGFCYLTLLADNKVYDSRKEHLIKIPDDFKGKRIAWGAAYFTGIKKSKTYPNIFFLILNYDTANSKIVFDKNGDGDFTNDSLLNIEPDKWFTATFYNSKDEEGLFVSDFLLKNSFTDSMYIKLFQPLTAKWPGALGPEYMVFDKRKNYKKVYLPDSNTITLYDYDCNGFFNDKEDKILAGDIQKDSRLYKTPFKNKNVKPGAELPFKNKTYKFLRLDKYGNSITLLPLNNIMDTTESLAKFQFINAKGNKENFGYTILKSILSFMYGEHGVLVAMFRHQLL